MKNEQLLKRLEEILYKNIVIYSDMAKALDAESEALVAHDLPQLEAAIEQKNMVVARLQDIEPERTGIVDKLAEAAGVASGELTLSQLCQQVDPGYGDKLGRLQSRLKELVTLTTQKNEFNQGVIEKLMNINYAAAQNLQELTNPSQSYAAGGAALTVPLSSGRVVSRTY